MASGDGYAVRSLATTYRDGHVLHEHHHAWGQLVYARGGVMRVITAVRAWLVPPTRAVWIPAGITHEIRMRGAVAMRTLYVAPKLAVDLAVDVAALEVSALLKELILHVLTRGMLHADEPAQARLAMVLVDCIAEARRDDLWLPLPADKRALALAEHLQCAPGDRTDLRTLAAKYGASLRHLQRLFPEQTGLTLDAWRQKARLIHAVAALAAGERVTSAALDCGYDSPSAFISAFKRQFGVTPGRYRGGVRD